MFRSHGQGSKVLGFRAQTVGATTLFKLENRNRSKRYRSQFGRRLRGKSENVYSGTRTCCFFSRSNKQEVRVPEYTFSLLPLNLRPIWLLYHFVRFRFSSLKTVVERTVGRSAASRKVSKTGVETLGGQRYGQTV